MVLTPPPDDIEVMKSRIPDDFIERKDIDMDEQVICECSNRTRDYRFYQGDKTEVVVCRNCGGLYWRVLNNWM